MSKTEEFLTSEKNRYGKIYVDICYAIDNISPFLEKEQLNKRKYVVKLPLLKKYIDLIEAGEADTKKGGFLGFFNNDKAVELIKEYKLDHFDGLRQLEKCSSCSCLNCTSACKFDSCLGCREGSTIASCDHGKINVTFHDSFVLDLMNDRTGRVDKYNVLATLQNPELDRKYIMIENIVNDEKFVLYYYPGIVEDSYGEITDGEEFDFIVSTYEGINV